MRAELCRSSGFTYLTVLFALGILGAGLAAVGVNWSHEAQRQREEELLYVGEQIRKAIGGHYQQSPGTHKRYPEKLEDLLLDSRFLTVRRHLRRMYIDPITGRAEWGLVRAPDGGIMGVYSLGQGKPIKISGFGPYEVDFAGAETYADWRFIYVPPEQSAEAFVPPVR